MHSQPNRWRSVQLLAALALVVVGLIPPRSARAAASPNIVILLTDDQRWDSAPPVTSEYMPNVAADLAANGIAFPDAFVSNSLCCPSRSSILTGDYSHTTGVYTNRGPWGGFDAFNANGDEGRSLGVDLQANGYRTALIGKYLNGYLNGVPPSVAAANATYVPPGWDRWFSVPTGAYYNYIASDQGALTTYGDSPADYATTVLENQAEQFIAGPSGRPFFLYLSFSAPHRPAIPDPRDVGRFGPRTTFPPSYEVTDTTKPAYMQIFRDRSTEIETLRQQQLDSVYGVDRAIGEVWNLLPDNTIVFFLSDNGYLWGEHRWSGKQVPYDEAIRVPIIVAAKGTTLPAIDTNRIAANIDLYPTIADLVGFMPNHAVDGESWLRPTARSSLVLEHEDYQVKVPTYCGLRTTRWMYVRYATGEEELYQEKTDPYEMDNLASRQTAKLDAMRAEAAAGCRIAGAAYPDDWPFGQQVL